MVSTKASAAPLSWPESGQVPRARPPRVVGVIRDPDPEEIGAPIDWSSWYVTDEEDMSEGAEQSNTIDEFKPSLRQLAAEQNWEDVYIGGDQFFAWLESEPMVRISPDVYLLDHPPPPPLPSMWETWKPGHRAPRFALEIVSGRGQARQPWEKDYKFGPPKYAQLGTTELVIFDPDVVLGRTRNPERFALQVYCREEDGSFVRVYRGTGPCESSELGVWLVVITDGKVARLRLSRDREGHELIPTAEEKAKSAEEENARLRAELERLKHPSTA